MNNGDGDSGTCKGSGSSSYFGVVCGNGDLTLQHDDGGKSYGGGG